MLARLALTLGGAAAVLLTPAFALSYFSAYGQPSELPPGWLAELRGPLTAAGLLEAGSTSVYDRYGLLYCAAWGVGLAGLVGFLRRDWPALSVRRRRAWVVVVTGLGVVAVGIFGDYAPVGDIAGVVGFLLTGLGFLIAAVGSALLGWALCRDRQLNAMMARAAGLFGVVSLVGGMALVGHIPSGPGVGWVLGALGLGMAGHRPTAQQTPRLRVKT